MASKEFLQIGQVRITTSESGLIYNVPGSMHETGLKRLNTNNKQLIQTFKNSKIMEFTKQELKQFRVDFKDMMEGIEEEYGVTIDLGNITYDREGIEFTTKMTVTNIQTADGTSIEQALFEKYCTRYGLEPEDYLKKIELNDREFEVYGFNPSARVKPYLIRDTKTQQRYVTKREAMERFLK